MDQIGQGIPLNLSSIPFFLNPIPLVLSTDSVILPNPVNSSPGILANSSNSVKTVELSQLNSPSIFRDGKTHYCYLLQSQNQSRIYYIGYTDNPYHRLRQHNGEITGGAKKTQKHRPWNLLCYISGFPNQRVALQWEWAWQKRSLKNSSNNSLEKTGKKRSLRNPYKRLEKLLTLEQVVAETIPSNQLSLQIVFLIDPPVIDINKFPGAIKIVRQ